MRFYPAAKRALDMTVAAALLLAVLPLLAIVALLIRLQSPGPVLFCQPREGGGGRLFRIRKLRTMHTDAGERLQRTLACDPQAAAEWTATLCLARDPRIAGRAGALARKYSIDELPQLWNVLIGEMSLVGPRPLEPDVAATLLDMEVRNARLQVRPGLSGLWQVSREGKRDVTASMRDLDLLYLQRRSLTLDLIIMLRTPRAVVSGGGLL